jgi:phosphatidylinositol glycan class Q protein
MDDWPVGLKLNTPLSGLLCSTFSGMADVWDCEFSEASWMWEDGRSTLLIHHMICSSSAIWTSDPGLSHKMILALSIGSYLGASMFLSVLKDIIGLSTVHLSTISWIMRQVYRAEVSAMYTLWNLFRGELNGISLDRRDGRRLTDLPTRSGKRWNTLRHRVDSFDYEIDQLFLGTLLFTVTIFLLPTIFTSYSSFSLVSSYFNQTAMNLEWIADDGFGMVWADTNRSPSL